MTSLFLSFCALLYSLSVFFVIVYFLVFCCAIIGFILGFAPVLMVSRWSNAISSPCSMYFLIISRCWFGFSSSPYVYLSALGKLKGREVSLRCPFPPPGLALSGEDLDSTTVESVGLVPRGRLMVQFRSAAAVVLVLVLVSVAVAVAVICRG